MKRLLSVLLIGTMPLLLSAQIEFESGFENEFSSEWEAYTTSDTFDRTTSSKKNGSYGFHLKFETTNKANLKTPSTIQWVAGKTYTISFWYKAITPLSDKNTWLKAIEDTGDQVNLDQLSFTSSEWELFEYAYDCKINGTQGAFLFSFRANDAGDGELYLDDIRIEERQPEGFKSFARLKTEKVLSDETIRWTQFGPGMSGNNKCAQWHPTDENVLFIGPNMGNSYKSADKGKTYETIFNEDESGFRYGKRGPREFTSIDFSRQNPDFGFCTDELNNGMYISQDRGSTWTSHAGSLPVVDGKYLSCIAVDPKDDNIWYLGGGRMRDLGRILFPKSHRHLWYHDRGNHQPSQKKIWKTTDKGKNWTLINTGLADETEVETIFVDPKNSNTVYASTNWGFYKSTNGGNTWEQKTTGLNNDVLRACDYHYDDETDLLTIYVIANPEWEADLANGTVKNGVGGIFKSIDRGESWTNVTGNLPIDMSQFKGNAAIEKSYFHAVAYWFELSDSEAKNLYPNMSKSITQRFNSIEIDPNDPNNIYVNNEYSNASRNNFMPGQIWRSKDGGENWFVTFRNGKGWKAGSSDHSYWVDRGNPTETNVKLKYLDNWVDRDLYDRKGCNFVKWNADGTVLHTQMAKISMFSYDGGDTWVDIDDEEIGENTGVYVGAGNSNVPGHGFFQHPDIPGKVFCSAGENSLFITQDGGDAIRKGAQAVKSVRFTSHEMSLSTYAIHPNNVEIHYALFFRQHSKGKLMRSTDGGVTWEEYGTAIPHWNIEAHGGDQSVHQINLIIDKDNPDNMYFCVPWMSKNIEYVGDSQASVGVHRSTDGGKTWSQSNTGLPMQTNNGFDFNGPDVTAITFDPNSYDVLYAAVQGKNGGLFKSTDNAKTWSEVSSTTNIAGVYGINDVHFDVDGRAYITAGNKRADIDAGGAWVSEDDMSTWTQIFDFPWTFRIETAMHNADIIMVSTLPANVNEGINAGTYLSKDAGKSWVKFNLGNGQSDRINDIAIDNYILGKYYTSTYGSGWYVAIDPDAKSTLKDVTKVTPSETSVSIKVDETYRLSANVSPSDATYKNVSWSSSNPDIATVNASGVITGVNVGTVTVTAKAFNSDVYADIDVIVGIETGIDELNRNFKIYPNPVEDTLSIDFDKKSFRGATVKVYSMSGLIIDTVKLSKDSNQISTIRYQPGTYVIKLITSEGTIERKFVKN
ncbi:Ig-like domain-containing protein [Reichenbachiella versicolor]|uniref:Ig-like domain-containing protein n=1 Tax=Reichenbachiella versicolor TaxID=1821036 RepID=UPI0013A5BC42|nr:Ig-like domain-containing protein [Reichenbachiella versicolor]